MRKTSIYFTNMSKQYYFFKNLVRGALEDNTFFISWDHLESWISQNSWMAIFFIIFLGIIFEIILIKIYTSFQKTPELPEKSSSNTQESEDSSLQSMTFDNYSIHSSSEERVDHFSERTMSSPLTLEESEGNVEDTASLADEPLRAGTSESKYQVSHLSESYMSFSNGSSSSLFHSEIKEIFLSQTGSSENEEQTIQYSSKKLFSIMKSNKNKTFMFSSDFNFSRTSRISSESEDLDMAPCPPAHLFLSRDQVRLLEENVRHQIPLKSKVSLERKVTYLYSRSQESLIQNHHPAQMNISTQTQDSSPGQNVIQNQSSYEAQLTSQPQQLVHNQEVINGQQATDVRSFALPQNLMRKSLSGSTQDSTQAQAVERRQHLVKDLCSVETQDSIKSTESDKQLDEPQFSVWPKDSDNKEDSLQKQNTFSKNARHLVLTVTPNSVAEGMPPLQKIKGKILEQIASSEFNQNSVSDPAPVLPGRQKKQRKILHSKSKFNAKVPSKKPKKAASSQAHQITVCHTSEHSKLGCHYNTKKKKELFQRKETSGKALSLTYVSKLVVPYIKKYSRKHLVEVVPDIKLYTHFLLKQDMSLDAEEVNYAVSFEKRGTSGNTENKKQQSRDNRGLKSIPPKISPQLEQSFMVNTFQLKAFCSSSVETSWKNKESPKDPVTQAKGTGIDKFFQALKSKGTCDLCIPKHQTPLAETVSEPLQEFVSPPNMKSNRGQKAQEGLRTSEQPHPQLSHTEEVPTSPPERSFPKGNTQRKTLKIVLESPDVNLLISLGTKKHDSREQSSDRDIQESTGDVIRRKEKVFSLHITGCGDPHESEGLEYNRANMRDQGVSGVPHRTAHTATSGPPDRKMHSGLEAKTEASRIVDFSYSAVRQEEFPDEKISPTANYIEKKCMSEKPQGHDKEEEEQVLQEAALEQTDFRLSLELKLQNEFVKFEIEQINSGNRETQNKEPTAQPQSVSTQTIWETNPCPIVGLFQGEKVKQSADRLMGRESADPKKPLTEPEKLPVGKSSLDTFASRVPFSEDLRKTPGPTAEEKQDLTRVFPAVALASFISQMLQSSYLMRQQISKILPDILGIFSPPHVEMKAKKPAALLMAFSSSCGIPSHRKRSRDNFKSIMKKQKPQDETVTEVLLNATYPHKTIFLHSRRQSRVNTETHSLAKPKQEKPQGEKEEECPDFLMKGDVARHRPEAKLQDEVRGDKMAPPKPALSGHWAPRPDVYPETELQTEKETQRPVPAGETTAEPTHSHVMEPARGAEGGPTAQADLRCAADSQTTPSPGAARAGNPLKQARESDGPGYESDVRETGYFFVERDLSDLSATSPETFLCHAPILSHSKVKKKRVRFSHIKYMVRPKSGHMKTVMPSRPQTFTIRSHRKKLESYFKTKCERMIQATGLVYEFLSTLYPPGPGRLQRDRFSHPQLIRGGPAVNERGLQYADFFAEMKNAFSDREEKVQDGKEEEQKSVPEAAPQHTQHLRPSVDHVDRQDPGLDFLPQEPHVSEQDAQHQTRFPETALHTDPPLGPREAEDIQKTNKTGNDLTAPMGAEIPPPQLGTISSDHIIWFDQCFKSTPECSLPCGRKPEKKQDSYFVATNLALQVSMLQSSDPLEMYVPAYKRKRNMLQFARQHMAVRCRCRTRRRERLSSSHMLDGMQSQGQQRRKRKHPEQSKKFADVFLDIIHSKVPILINIKMSSGLNGGKDMHRITRLDHMQVMREKSPNRRGVCCLDYAEMISLSHRVRDGEEVAGEHADPLAPEASQDFLLDAHQKKNQNLTELDEELKQPGSTNIQVQPQPHRISTVLGSASCPLFYQFQLGKLEGLARFSPPTSREAKTDGIIFSASKCGIPSGVRHHKGEWLGGAGKKETVTFDLYEPASATSRRRRNFKQHSDMRTLVNSTRGIRKANKPSILYILSVKGRAGPHCGKESRHGLSPNMEEMAPGKEMAATVSPFMSGSPGSSTYSKTGREKYILGEKRLGSQQVKQEIKPHGGTIPADETKEANRPDQKEGENEQETLLKNILQHSQHFIFCSGQRKELVPHESVDQELDAPQLQPVDLVQVELPKPSPWTHADTCCTVRSHLQLLKAKESLAGQVLIATVKYGLPRDGSHVGELHRSGNEDEAEAQKDIQATVLEPSDVPTSNLPESDRQRKMFTRRALRSQMSSRCIVMKARKASQILNISGNGCPKNPPPKIQKSHISGFLVHRKYSVVPQGHTIEKREGLAQELPTTVPESWDLSTLTLPVMKRKRNNLKLRVKINKMSPTCVTLKVKKAPTFLTFKDTKQGISCHRRHFERNLKIMMKQGQHVANIILNAISSFILVSPDKKVHHVQTDLLWETGVSHKLLLQAQPAGGARAEARSESTSASSRHRDGEASWEGSQHFRADAHKMKAPGSVKADLELEDSVSMHSPQSPIAAQEPRRPALFTRTVVHSASHRERIADIFSSPTPVASDDKIDTEILNTLKIEVDKTRVKTCSCTDPEGERPAHEWGVWKASSADTQNMSSNTRQRKERCEKEEDEFLNTLPTWVPHARPHLSNSSLYVQNLGLCKSGLEQDSLEGRRTWNLSGIVQKMSKEKHIRETILKPISRHVMNVLQVKTVKKRPDTQAGREGRAHLKSPLPKAGTSEVRSIQDRNPQDRDPRKRWDGPITEEKACNQNDLLRTVFSALDFPGLQSAELKSQDYTLGCAGQKGMSPKHGPWKAEKLPMTRLLQISRALPGNHRKKLLHMLKKRKEQRRQGSRGQLLFCAPRGARNLPPASVMDKLLLATVVWGTLYNRIHHGDLGGHTPEEKTEEVGENLAPAFLGPLDSKSQQDTVLLSGKKIVLTSKCLTVKKKEPPISHIFKIDPFTTKCREKHGSNLKTQMKEMKPSHDVAETVSFVWDTSDTQRQNRLKIELDRMPRSRHIRLAPMELPAEGLVTSYWLNTPGHAAFCIPEEQEQKTDNAREDRTLTTDLKPAPASVPVLPHAKTEPLPGAWGICDNASEKEHALNKAKVREKEEYEQQVMFRTTSQNTPPPEFGTAQGRGPGPFKLEAPLNNTEGLKDRPPQQTESDLKDQEAQTGVVEGFCPESSPYSKMHLPPREAQKKDTKAASGRKEHPRESPGEALPTSASHSPTHETRSKPPWVRSQESLADRTSNTEGVGLLAKGKVGRLGLADHTSLKSACRSARELFQRQTALKNKALEEAVSTGDYTPIAQGIGSLIMGKRGQRANCTSEVPSKPTSCSKISLLQGHSPGPRTKLESANLVRQEHAPPQGTRALKGANVILGDAQKSTERQYLPGLRQKQQHLCVPGENFPRHLSYLQNDSWLLPHLMALTRNALSEVSSVSNSTKAVVLCRRDQAAAACECKPGWVMSLTPAAQMKTQNAVLPWELREIMRYLNTSFPNGKKSLDGAQGIDAIPSGSAPKESTRKKVQSHEGDPKARTKVCPPEIFAHSLAIYLPTLSESKRQMGRANQGLEKAMLCPKRRTLGLRRSVFSRTLNAANYGASSSRPELQQDIKEKVARMKHSRAKSDLVVTSIYGCIPPSPHPRLNRDIVSGRISDNGERTKQHILLKKQDRIKGVKLSLPLLPIRKELPVLLKLIKQESKAEGGKEVDLTNVCSWWSSWPCSHWNTRLQVGGGKPRTARSCLLPPKLQASSKVGKISFAESINRESLINVLESKQHSPLRKKEDRGNIVYGNNLTLWELPATMGMYEEPTDDILSSIKKAKYSSKERVEMTLEEMRSRKREALKVRLPAYAQWSLPGNERKMLGEKYKNLRIQSKSCPSIFFLPYSEVITSRKVKQIGTKFYFLQTHVQASLDKGKIVCKRPVSTDTSHGTKKAKEHIIQEQERIKTAKTVLLKTKKSSSSQEIQLAIKEEETIEKMTSVVLANTSACTPAPSPLKLDPGIKKLGSVIEITKYSLPKRSQREPRAMKKANKDPVWGSVLSNIQEAAVCPPQKEEVNAKLSARTDLWHLKEKGLEDKEALPGDIRSHTTEHNKGCAGSAGQGGPDATGEGEQEAVRPASLASESSLAHHEPGQRAEGKEDREGITRDALSQLQPQKSPEGEKMAQTKPTGEDTSDIKMAQEHKPQNAEDRGDTQNIKSIIYPKGATSRAKVLPLLLVLRTPKEQASPAEVLRKPQDKGGHGWERESEPGEVPTNPPLPPLKINKGVEGPGGPRGVMEPFSPRSWDRESSDAGDLKHKLPPWCTIASNSERAEDTARKREDKANVLKKEGTHPMSAALRAKQFPLSHTLETETLQVSVTEHADGGQAGGGVQVVILSKIFPFLTFSTHLKLDATKAEAGEPRTGSSASHLELQESLPSGQTAPAEQVGCGIKKAEYQADKENHGVQAAPRDGFMHPDGQDCKAETALPPGVLHASECCGLPTGTSKDTEGGEREQAEQELGRGGDEVSPTETPPPAPRPPHWRLALRREALFARTRLFLQRPRPSRAGEARNAGPQGGMCLWNMTIQDIRCISYVRARDGEKMKEEEGRIFSKILSLRAERPPCTHQPRRAPSKAKQPEKGICSSRGKGKPRPVLTESLASFPSLPYLKRGIGGKEREDIPGIAKPHFPPLKIQDPYNSGERAQAQSSDRNMFKGQDRSKTDIEDKTLPKRMGLQAKQFSLSSALSASEPQWETKEQESKTQKDKDLLMGLKSICTSFLTLPYFKCDLRGEGYMLRIIKLPLSQLPSQESSDAEKTACPPTTGAELSSDLQELEKCMLQTEEKDSEKNAEMSRVAEARGVDLETKKSPVLLAWRQSGLLRQTEVHEARVLEGKQAPGVEATPTCAPRAAPLRLPTHAGVEQEGVQKGRPTVTRASVPLANFQESSEAEKADQVAPEAREMSTPLRHGTGSTPMGRAGDRAGLLLPARPGKAMQEGEDEPGAVLTASSSPRSGRPPRMEDKTTQADCDPPALRRSAWQRTSEAREAVPVEPGSGGAIKAVQNEEPREPRSEERERDSAMGQRGETHCVHITLKSKMSPRPTVLHRTELHLPLPWRSQRQPHGQGKTPSPVQRNVCVSKPPPRSLPLGRGPRGAEERLRAQRPLLLPPTQPALPNAEKAAGSEAWGANVRKGKQRGSQIKCGLRTVDLNIRVQHREAVNGPVSRILEAQGLVLNVKVLTGPRHTDNQESRIFLTRAFLCTPAAVALDLEPGSKADKTASRVAGSSGPQGMLREASDAQTVAPGEAADGDCELVAESGGEAPQQWTSDFLICVQGRKEPLQVQSKGDFRKLVLNSQDGDVYFTGFGTISSRKRLECLFTGQKAQLEKYKTETSSTFHSCPAMKLTKGENQEEEAEPKDNSDCRAGAEGFASQLRETPGFPVSSKALHLREPNAQAQDTLSKAAPGSADSNSASNMPGEDGPRDNKVSQAVPTEGPAPQTWGSCEDVKVAEPNSLPKRNRTNVLPTQVVLLSESGPQPGQNASCPLSWPLPKRMQKTPLGTDMCKQMLLRPSTQLLPGSHEGTMSRGGAWCLLASQQVENILEPLQNFLTPYWAFSPCPADQVGRNECGTGTVINLEQKTFKREKGKLKLGTNMAVHLQEKKIGEVSVKEKRKKGKSNPPKQKGLSLKAAKSPVQTQVMAPMVKSCPVGRKHKKELGGTDQDTQPQTLFPKQVVLDSLFAYIPLPPKFEGWKGRVTMADLRRELSPKYLTIKIPNHPVPQILDNLGRGVPSNRMKLEYDFTKPKIVLWRREASGIAIRSLSVVVVSPPQMREMRVSERNPRRRKRIGLSEFPGKSANTREAPWSRISSSTPEEGRPGVPGITPQDPQPFLAPEWQMQKPPGVKSEANLSRERNERFLTPQTEHRAVPGYDFPKPTREPDSLVREQEEKAPESFPTPTECPFLAEAARERLESCMKSTQTLSLPPPAGEAAPGGSQLGHSSGCTSSPEPCLPEPTPGTGTLEAQPSVSSPGPGPAPHQVATNERKLVAGARGPEESLSPLFEAVKNIFASQMESMIQDKVYAEVLKQVRAHSSAAEGSVPLAEPDPPSRAPPHRRPEALLEHFTAREKRKLTNHLKAKALESKADLIPERVKQSSQKYHRHSEGGLISGDGAGRQPSRWSPGHQGQHFLTGGGTVAAEVSLKHCYQGGASAVGYRKNLTVHESEGSKKILTKNSNQLPSRASSVPFANERPLSYVLQKFSTQEIEKLLIHFSMRTLEIQMKSLPRIVRESYAMASAQDRRRPLAKCVHPVVRAPKRQKRIVLLFEEKSLHQIDLDLQYKYQRFLLGLPVARMFPESKALPKYTPKSNPAARGKKVDCRAEGGSLRVHTEVLGKHLSFKKSLPELASSIRKVLEPAPVCASDPGPQGVTRQGEGHPQTFCAPPCYRDTVQKDMPVPPEVKFNVTPEKERKCHVWFQETEACKPSDSRVPASAHWSVDSCSSPTSEDSADTLKDVENWAALQERPTREGCEGKECLFWEVKRYLSREAGHILCGGQKGSWQGLPKAEKLQSSLPSEACPSHHIGSSRRHTPSQTPSSCGSRQSKKSRVYPHGDGAPRGLCGGALSTPKGGLVPSGASSCSSSDTTSGGTGQSLFALTESNIKSHLAKSQGRLHRRSERRDRQRATEDSPGKSSPRACAPRSAPSEHSDQPCPGRRPQDGRKDAPKRGARPFSRQKLASPACSEEAGPPTERRRAPPQPFFYACVPADSLEVTPKTVRWAIPPKALRKRNFRLPLVAKVSSSSDLFSSSKHLLEAFLGSFSLVPRD